MSTAIFLSTWSKLLAENELEGNREKNYGLGHFEYTWSYNTKPYYTSMDYKIFLDNSGKLLM